MALQLQDKIFGALLPYIKDENITDVNWNGTSLWINHLRKGRYCIFGFHLEKHFVEQFSQYLANLMNKSFNQYDPILEADTDELRISIIHESVTATGRSISIRKTPAVRRLCKENMIASGYCSEDIHNFLENCVRAKMSIVFCGLPGAGKTELLKACTAYIPANERVITIEDNLEIRYRDINPGKDCVSLRVDEAFSYEKALKTCLRQLADWIMLSEARSVEVKYLIENMSNGTHCLTTLHADDVRKIPDRMMNMLPEYKANILNHIYSFLDVGVLVRSKVTGKGIEREIAQIGVFSRENETNRIHIIWDGTQMNQDKRKLPSNIQRKFQMYEIEDPFAQYRAGEGVKS